MVCHPPATHMAAYTVQTYWRTRRLRSQVKYVQGDARHFLHALACE